MDFSRANQDVLIAKLAAYDSDALKLVKSYLSERIQRVKINGSYSRWRDIKNRGTARISSGTVSIQCFHQRYFPPIKKILTFVTLPMTPLSTHAVQISIL